MSEEFEFTNEKNIRCEKVNNKWVYWFAGKNVEETFAENETLKETIAKMAEALRSCEFKEFGEMVFRDDLVCAALELAKPWLKND